MRGDARLTVGPGRGRGVRVEEMVGQAPIAWRTTPAAVYMVGTAASPVGHDDVTVSVRVRAGARLALRSTAATVVWSGAGTRQAVRVVVEDGAELDWCPEPLITTAGCNHRQEAVVDVAPGGRLLWQDITVLGRDGEPPGRLHSGLRVSVGGVPVLHHVLGVGADHPGWDGPAIVAAAKVVGQLLVAGPGADHITPGAGAAVGAAWSTSPLPGPAALVTAVAGSVGAVEAALAEAAGRFGGAVAAYPCR